MLAVDFPAVCAVLAAAMIVLGIAGLLMNNVHYEEDQIYSAGSVPGKRRRPGGGLGQRQLVRGGRLRDFITMR